MLAYSGVLVVATTVDGSYGLAEQKLRKLGALIHNILMFRYVRSYLVT